MPKVLHVVENLDRGAIENWLVRMLQHAVRRGEKLDWTFYCTLPQKGAIEDMALAAGAGVVYSPVTISGGRLFIGALRRELQSGAYDVLHCHHDLMSAVYLLSALGTPVGRRIVHIHNADEGLPTSAVKQRVLREPMRQTCLALADRIVGISNHTLDTFLSGRPRRKGRDSVHYYGVNSVPHTAQADDRLRFRRELGFPDDALVFLFGGRLVPEKNSVFVSDIFASLRQMEPRAVCVFAGAGSQEGAVLGRTRVLGVEDATRLLGWRTDLARIMSCSDWFVLPRPEAPMEGFGLAILEAQLAGLRLLLSRGIPDDPLLPTARYRRLALAVGADTWAKAAVELMQDSAPSQQEAVNALARSPMDMDFALEDLLRLYR